MPEAIVGGAAVGALYASDPDAKAPEDWTTDDVIPPRVQNTAGRVADNVRDSVKATAKHVKDWWTYEPEVKAPNPVPNTYCYRTYGDVLCYRAPMPGWENRLVGYQGTYAEAPPPVMMEPLPGQAQDSSMLPENRLAAAAPVFNEMPEEVKEEKTIEELAEPTPENLREVADPALAPQL